MSTEELTEALTKLRADHDGWVPAVGGGVRCTCGAVLDALTYTRAEEAMEVHRDEVLAAFVRTRESEAARLGKRATLDPGSFVKRNRDDEGDYERMDRWQERAISAALEQGDPR